MNVEKLPRDWSSYTTEMQTTFLKGGHDKDGLLKELRSQLGTDAEDRSDRVTKIEIACVLVHTRQPTGFETPVGFFDYPDEQKADWLSFTYSRDRLVEEIREAMKIEDVGNSERLSKSEVAWLVAKAREHLD